jgi:hypothetical protein
MPRTWSGARPAWSAQRSVSTTLASGRVYGESLAQTMFAGGTSAHRATRSTGFHHDVSIRTFG